MTTKEAQLTTRIGHGNQLTTVDSLNNCIFIWIRQFDRNGCNIDNLIPHPL